MTPVQLSMNVGSGPYCEGCALRGPCGQADTPRACQPIFGDPRYGGLNVLHFAHDYLDRYFEEVRGPEFDDVRFSSDDASALSVELIAGTFERSLLCNWR